MALHRRRAGETVAAERKRLGKRQDTVAGRATKRQNVRSTPATPHRGPKKLNRGRLKKLRFPTRR